MKRLPLLSALPDPARLWRWAGLLFSLTLVVLLLDALDLDAFRVMAAGISPDSLLLALLIYLMLNFFRTLRFQVLLAADAPPLAALWPVVLVHNLLVRVLPFKAGEFSWMLLLRRHFGQAVGAGFGSLVSARLFELLIVLLVGGSALVQGSAQFTQARPTLLALLAAAFLLCLALLFSASGFLRLATRLLQRRRGLGQRVAGALARAGNQPGAHPPTAYFHAHAAALLPDLGLERLLQSGAAGRAGRAGLAPAGRHHQHHHARRGLAGGEHQRPRRD